MKRHSILIGLVLILVMNCGCATVITRGGRHPFGAYPYQAASLDIRALPSARPDESKVIHTSQKILLTAADGLVDTILLPLDLIFWAFGVHKDGAFRNMDRETEHPPGHVR